MCDEIGMCNLCSGRKAISGIIPQGHQVVNRHKFPNRMLKELKQTMFKELKESMKTMTQPIENLK